MLLGTSKQDITPVEPIELAGFSHRKGKASEIHEPLYLRTYLIQSNEVYFLFFVADLIWWDTAFVKRLGEVIEKRFNIPVNQICFHATHNHSGPQTSFRFSSDLGNPNNEYLDLLEHKVINSIVESLSDLEKVKMQVNKGTAEIGVNRRKKINGIVQMEPNIEGEVDNDLTVISFITEKGIKKGIWIHYTCHPTTTDANVISSEFTGYCCKKVEEQYSNSNVAFLQGFCGDIRPSMIRDGSFYRGSIKKMADIGLKMSNKVLDLLNEDGDFLDDAGQIAFRVAEFPLSFDNDTAVDMYIPEPLKDEWPNLVKNTNGNYNLIIQYIELSEKLSLLCCNAEMVHEYGRFIKQIDEDILPLGYSNGMVGYVPTEMQLKEGGYEAEESLFYFGYPSKLASYVEKDIEKEIKTILGREGIV
ncbi:neutral/alkaline non-lysosomal ceramidase N-terminal domain-containing protein [Virgibacillus sp. JSM 102003]|uniref:neutral/alkaline non-lysosomal ceramidase N-terminal domain-containing protein n=1 Tax=Virgibacillus sp. JSM 102003 TaxID=1562108 RepID=UPI0035BFEAAB